MDQSKDLVATAPLSRLTESPEKAVELLNSVKTNFSKLLKQNKEIISIPTKQGKKDYVRYEGWVTIATVMGIMPRIVELTKIDRGYQAKAEAVVIRTGQVVGAAYGICSKDEPTWAQRPEFSIAAMAQTRAAARALKTILGGVITHIGFEGTPVELIEEEDQAPTPKQQEKQPKPEEKKDPESADARVISEPQQKRLFAICRSANMPIEKLKDYLSETYGIDHTDKILRKDYNDICKWAEGAEDSEGN